MTISSQCEGHKDVNSGHACNHLEIISFINCSHVLVLSLTKDLDLYNMSTLRVYANEFMQMYTDIPSTCIPYLVCSS